MRKSIFLIFITTISMITFSCKKDQFPDGKASKIVGAYVSSTLESKDRDFHVTHLYDNSIMSWCEGKKDSGIGENFGIDLDGNFSVHEIFIKNGFGDPAYFKPNNRVNEMEVTGDKGGKEVIKLADSPDIQSIKLKNVIEGRRLTFKILSVYKGEKWDDTCITEVAFKAFDIQPKKSILEGRSFPIKASYASIKFILHPNGRLEGSGHEGAQCPSMFEKGQWKTKPNGRILITYTTSYNTGCNPQNLSAAGEIKYMDNNCEIYNLPIKADEEASCKFY